ncbi:MAG TPA: hypothetical protein VGO48_05015 [Conexibacter sp.]|jgi:hypothetical protein|nr:hypothetical protein [Conexibacter sp.]
MTRRRALWILGIVTLGLFAVLLALDGWMQDAGSHGIVAFEVAFTSGKAQEIIIAWGSKGHDAAQLSLWIDFLYLIAYGLFLWLAVRALGDALRNRGMDGWARPAATISVLPLVIAGADAVEDIFLLLVLGGHASSIGPPLAGSFATLKFACLAVVVVYLLAGLVALALSRRSAPAR